MAIQRAPGASSLSDVLDRVLDKGIVIDAWVRMSLAGIDLMTAEAQIVVASIDTHLKYAGGGSISQGRWSRRRTPRRRLLSQRHPE